MRSCILIISAYEGNKIDCGIITSEGVRAAMASFQSGKKMLSVITHFLTVLYPPSSLSSPRALSSPPPPRKQREKLTTLTQEAWEEPTPPSPPAAAQTLHRRHYHQPKHTSPARNGDSTVSPLLNPKGHYGSKRPSSARATWP